MTSDTDSNSDSSPSREYVHHFNVTLRDYQKYGGIYNPLLYPIIVVDLLLVVYWLLWHRFQSAKASRQGIHTSMMLEMRKHERIYNDDDSTPREKADAKESLNNMLYICEKMNLKSEMIDGVRDTIEDSEP